MRHHSVPVEDGSGPACGAYLIPGADRLIWRGPYHDAAALDLASRTHMAYMVIFYAGQLGQLIEEATA